MKAKKVVSNKQEPGWEEWVSSIQAAGKRNGDDPAELQGASGALLREAIAKLAYSYWEARGYQDGSAEEDWLRAEAEIRTKPQTQPQVKRSRATAPKEELAAAALV
jgi:hypothetical protein